jgi:hypothetical protein
MTLYIEYIDTIHAYTYRYMHEYIKWPSSNLLWRALTARYAWPCICLFRIFQHMTLIRIFSKDNKKAKGTQRKDEKGREVKRLDSPTSVQTAPQTSFQTSVQVSSSVPTSVQTPVQTTSGKHARVDASIQSPCVFECYVLLKLILETYSHTFVCVFLKLYIVTYSHTFVCLYARFVAVHVYCRICSVSSYV